MVKINTKTKISQLVGHLDIVCIKKNVPYKKNYEANAYVKTDNSIIGIVNMFNVKSYENSDPILI